MLSKVFKCFKGIQYESPFKRLKIAQNRKFPCQNVVYGIW